MNSVYRYFWVVPATCARQLLKDEKPKKNTGRQTPATKPKPKGNKGEKGDKSKKGKGKGAKGNPPKKPKASRVDKKAQGEDKGKTPETAEVEAPRKHKKPKKTRGDWAPLG